jgi:AcrR family transcriptional regulator
MAPLSKTAGRSRAAVYLYFANREEVLLALYLEETRAWLEELTAPDMAIDDYLRAVFSSASRRQGARAGVGGCFNDERSCSGSHWRRLLRGIVLAPL